MARKRHSAEQIITKLREAEVLLAQGRTVGPAGKAIGVTEQTDYRWRKEDGGLKLDQARRLTALEREHLRLLFSIRGAWVNPLACPPGERANGPCGALASLRGRRIGRHHDGIRRRGRSHLSRALGKSAVAPVSPVSPAPAVPAGTASAPEETGSSGTARPHAAAADQRKSVPSRHMRWSTIASLRATATMAFCRPRRLATATPHALSALQRPRAPRIPHLSPARRRAAVGRAVEALGSRSGGPARC
jgi:putative transposase